MKRAVIVMLLLIWAISLFGCQKTIINVPTIKGFSLSPQSYSSDDFRFFLEQTQLGGSALRWAGSFSELTKVEDNSALSSVRIARSASLTPIVETQFFEHDTLQGPLTDTQIEVYSKAVADFVQKSKVPYIGLGVEINHKFRNNPELVMEYAKVFDRAYDAIKKVSPATKVFVTFQLEWMKGLRGGLFGQKNESNASDWSMLKLFDKADLFGFTTYPFLVYQHVSEIPGDYYAEITKHTTKPIAFTEVGWHTTEVIPGWSGTEDEQAKYISLLFTQTHNLKPELMLWAFLFDQQTQPPFTSIGLFDSEGNPRKGWAAWREGGAVK